MNTHHYHPQRIRQLNICVGREVLSIPVTTPEGRTEFEAIGYFHLNSPQLSELTVTNTGPVGLYYYVAVDQMTNKQPWEEQTITSGEIEPGERYRYKIRLPIAGGYAFYLGGWEHDRTTGMIIGGSGHAELDM